MLFRSFSVALRRHLLASLLAAFATLLLAPAPAVAEPLIRLSDGFKPHPFVSDTFKVKIEKVYMSDAGFRKCGSSFTTKAPVFTFELTEKMEDLNLYFSSTNVVLVFPDGAYGCSNQGNFRYPEWPAGTYKVFYFSSSIGASANVRIEQPERLKKEVFAAFGKTPKILFDGSAATNPQFVALPSTPSAFARELEFGCAKGLAEVQPLARVEVKEEGQYYLRLDGGALLVASATGCVKDQATLQNNTNYNNLYFLKPGSYSLWSYPRKEGKPRILEAGNEARALAFGEAAQGVRELGELLEPQLISGTTRPAEAWPARRNACSGARGAARAPDFIFHFEKPVPQVELSLFRNRAKVAYRLYGPLEKVGAYSGMICDQDRQTFPKLEGSYAVWLTAAPKQGPSEYDLLVMRKDLKVDPMQTLKEIPETLTLEERRVADSYPFYGKMSHGTLFTRAPDRLFVYAAEAVTDGDQKVLAGEPLLLLELEGETARLARYDGSAVSVPVSGLLEVAPAKLRLPLKPSFKPAKERDEVWRLIAPADKKAVDRMEAKEDRYHGCVGAWMKKNDPTWGKDYELVYVSGRDAGKTMSDKKFEQAARVCKEVQLIAAQKAFVRQINLAAKKRAGRQLAAVRKRFEIR